MVNPKKLVNVYLPEKLYQALITYQQQHGFDEAANAVVEILTQVLHPTGEVKRYATIDQLEALEGKVSNLSQQMTQLRQAIASSTPKNDSTHPATTTQRFSGTVESTSVEEEEEDEPDEILYEFLEPRNPPSSSR